MNNDDKTKLILGVEKPLWLAAEAEPSFKIIGWTTKKPAHDNGFIDKGAVLIFSYLYTPDGSEGLNFISLRPGQTFEQKPEFDQKEIDSLIKEGALKLLDIEDIEEISIAMEYAFIKYFNYIPGIELSFDAKVFSPKDIYVIMGIEENRKSIGGLKLAEKISLKHIIEVYATAIGQRLILK